MTDACKCASKRPLAPSLKKPAPPSLAAKWGAACLDVLGGHRRHSHDAPPPVTRTQLQPQQQQQQRRRRRASLGDCRHVQFRDDGGQEFERPATTDAEKASYHYSAEELGRMQRLAKHLATHCAARFDGLPADTIVEQGYLTLPTRSVFFPRRRYYCLLKRHQLLCYATPAHAARGAGLKTRLAVIRAQDAARLPLQQQLALFGAHLPDDLARVLVVTTPAGDRVPLTAESKLAKRSWLHTLRKLTEVVEPASSPSAAEEEEDDDDDDDDDDASPTGSQPADKRQRANTESSGCSTSVKLSEVSTATTLDKAAS